VRKELVQKAVVQKVFMSALVVAIGLAAEGRASAAAIEGHYVGRYLCQGWNWVDLRISDAGQGRIGAVFTIQAPGGGATTSYSLTGQYNAGTDVFQLAPVKWIGRPVTGMTMGGMAGRLDQATRQIRGRILEAPLCSMFELAGDGGTPLPAAPPVVPGQPGAQTQGGVAPPQQNGIEYWDSSMGGAGQAPRETEPIDDVVDWLHGQGFYCLSSYHAFWNAEGTRAVVDTKISTRARFVVECTGDCKGLRYSPLGGVQSYSYGRSQPLPVMELKSTWFGGTPVQWVLTRLAASMPPDVYIHQWSPTRFDYGPGCRAPKSGGASDSQRESPEDRFRRMRQGK
jgi:hypothetical protein